MKKKCNKNLRNDALGCFFIILSIVIAMQLVFFI